MRWMMTAELAVTDSVSIKDIRLAASEGVIQAADCDRLLEWMQTRTVPAANVPRERAKGVNLVSVAYYCGALLMISACAWFLGDKWQALGHAGVLMTCAVYATGTVAIGIRLRRRGYAVAGGLLVTVAVALVPLATYTVEDMLGLWPVGYPGSYARFYPWIHGSWIVMELATIVGACIALLFVRFGFLVAPLAFSCWFLSMDLAALCMRVNHLTWRQHEWVSAAVGLATIATGFGLGRTLGRKKTHSEDFSFWCYLFGLLAFWGGLCSLARTLGIPWVSYALISVGLMAVGVAVRRVTFLVFGALGTWDYVAHLAYDIFRNSVLFPFALAGIGLGMILTTVWAQQWLRRVSNPFSVSAASEIQGKV